MHINVEGFVTVRGMHYTSEEKNLKWCKDVTTVLILFAVDAKLMQGHLAAIRHARWFEENAFHSR